MSSFDLVIPFTPTASKNRQRIIRLGKGENAPRRVVMSKAAADDMKAIEDLAWEELARRKLHAEFLTGSLGFKMIWQPFFNRTIVNVAEIGFLTKLPGAKRDISNMDAVILDALQGIAYGDDSQVSNVMLVTDDQARP